MAVMRGRLTRLRFYEEEGQEDWRLVLSRLGWYALLVAVPVSVWRLFSDMWGLLHATLAILILAVVVRLLGPSHFLSFDEVLCRLFPRLRPAFRLGLVRIWDRRLRLEEGGEVACLLRGDLVGAAPVEGDILRLAGSFRQVTFHVSQGWNETTDARLAPRPTRTIWVFGLTAAISGLFLFYLIIGALDDFLHQLLTPFLSPDDLG